MQCLRIDSIKVDSTRSSGRDGGSVLSEDSTRCINK